MTFGAFVLRCHGITRAGSAAPNGGAMLVGTGADPALFAVTEGVGGSRGAASSLAVTVLADLGPGGSLRGAFQWANCEILNGRRGRHARCAGAGRGVASLVALRIRGGSAAELCNVGDARAYLLRGGILGELTEAYPLVPVSVRRCAATAARGPGRGDAVAGALGRRAEVRVDRRLVGVRPGDRFVLCSNGPPDLVPDAEISRVLGRTAGHPRAAARWLAAAATRTGHDDLTVVVVDVATADSGRSAGSADLAASVER